MRLGAIGSIPYGGATSEGRGAPLARAALIIVDAEVPRLFGFEWVELCVRRLQRLGAAQTVVVANRVPAALVTALDRLRRDGIAVTLVREGAQAADLFHPDEDVVLLTGTHLAPAALLDSLLAAAAPAIACLPATSGEAFERIDAETRWAGFALIGGEMVRATAAIVGDWDLASTLLRAAVQASATRVVASPLPLRVGDPASAAETAASMLDETAPHVRGWATRWLVAPLARVLAYLARRQAASIVAWGSWTALLLGAACILFAVLGSPALAATMFLGAAVTQATRDRWSAAIGRTNRWTVIQRKLVDGSAAIALLVIAWQCGERNVAIGTALVVIAVMALLFRLPDRARVPGWMTDVAGNALLLLVGAAFGSTGIVVALVAMAVHAFASLAAGQNSLSRVLTSSL